MPRFAREALEAEGLYSGYLERQEADIVALRKDENLALPADLDYAALPSLSAEIRQKLTRVRPATIGQAARIEGVTPAALHCSARPREAPRCAGECYRKLGVNLGNLSESLAYVRCFT